jgi:hypothetical protein
MLTAPSGSMTAITSRSEPALAASPAVHASSKSITGASTLLEVQRVLQEEFKLPSDVALSIATAFRNSGAGVTSGVQLMKTLRTFGPEAFRWIYNGIRHKNGVADKISTIDNYLSLWRAHCSDITHVRHMADGWIQVRHENERSVKFPQGMYKPQWVKEENGKAIVSAKIVEFVKHFFPDENAQRNKYNNFLGWGLAHLNAECHELGLPALPDGYLRETFIALKNTGKQLRRNQSRSLIARKVDGTYQDLHTHISGTIGMAGVLWIIEQMQMQQGLPNWSEKDILQTQLLTLLQTQCGLRFDASGIIRLHLFYLKHCMYFGEYGRDALCYITNNGKANQNNHLTSVATIAHRNPRMCVMSAFAELLLLLWQEPVAKAGAEDFMMYVDLCDPSNFMEFEMCNTDNEGRTGDAAKRKYAKFKRRYGELLELYREHADSTRWPVTGALKKTHQWRLECIRMMQALGVPKAEREYFLNKFGAASEAKNDEMHKTYLDVMHTKAVTANGGFSTCDPRHIVSPHMPEPQDLIGTSCYRERHSCRRTLAGAPACRKARFLRYFVAGAGIDLTALVHALEPEVQRMRRELDESLQAKSEQERNKSCVVTAQSVARTMSAVLQTLLLTSAARPRGANGEIMKDEKPLYQTKKLSLYRRPVFESVEYQSLCAFVRTREDSELAGERP